MEPIPEFLLSLFTFPSAQKDFGIDLPQRHRETELNKESRKTGKELV
jgi:hypothetical protein